jgi:cytochrome b561
MHHAAPVRYASTAIVLHWLMFVLIACGFALAVYMTGLPRRGRVSRRPLQARA